MQQKDPIVRSYPDLEALSRAAARALATDVTRVLETADAYTLALAGGSTPERLYELLASGEEGTIPWARVHLFWGDERYVPHDHPKSNVSLARRTLIDNVAIPEQNVHPMPTDAESPEAAAAAYSDVLRRFFPDRSSTFDTALLGLGSDGHTASLFPETPSFAEDEGRWVRVVEAPPRHDVSTRLTCTVPVLNGAHHALFLVAGTRKREAVRGVLDQKDPSLPATHVRPQGRSHWYVDRQARPPADS